MDTIVEASRKQDVEEAVDILRKHPDEERAELVAMLRSADYWFRFFRAKGVGTC